jgi:hypothetical protein
MAEWPAGFVEEQLAFVSDFYITAHRESLGKDSPITGRAPTGDVDTGLDQAVAVHRDKLQRKRRPMDENMLPDGCLIPYSYTTRDGGVKGACWALHLMAMQMNKIISLLICSSGRKRSAIQYIDSFDLRPAVFDKRGEKSLRFALVRELIV